MKKCFSMLIFSALLVLSNCGDNGSDQDNGIKTQFWNVISYPQEELLTLITSTTYNTVKTPQTIVTEADYTVNGNCGGTCHISGSFSSTDDIYTADIDLDFTDFCFADIILNGHSDLIISEMIFPVSGSLTYIGTYSGEAEASGEIEGSCTWDLSLNCSSGNLTVHGTITINNKDYDF